MGLRPLILIVTHIVFVIIGETKKITQELLFFSLNFFLIKKGTPPKKDAQSNQTKQNLLKQVYVGILFKTIHQANKPFL